jgi:protein-disulfide isomerase
VKRLIAIAAACLLLAASGPKWTSVVTKSAIGGHVLGNPAAPVKLVEYLSYTCGHCAHFSREASAPLKQNYVSGGRVSLEFRNAVRDQFDLTAALAARCGGPAKFFGNSEAILAAQPRWMATAQSWMTANGEKMRAMPIDTALVTLSKALGFEALLAKRGVTPARLKVCMADKAAQKQIIAMTKDAFETRKLTGTPGFVINDELLDHTHDWAALETRLKSALAKQ